VRRFLIAVAVADYRYEPDWNRPDLVQARQTMVDLFTGVFGYELVTTVGMNPTYQQLYEELRVFCMRCQEQDVIAFYFTGHGGRTGLAGKHVVYMADTKPSDVAGTGFLTENLGQRMLEGTPVRRLLLMLDTCYSGAGSADLAAPALTHFTGDWLNKHGEGVVVISSAQQREEALAAAFPHLLRGAVNSLATAGRSPRLLEVGAVVGAMNAGGKPRQQTALWTTASHAAGELPPFLPNPRWDPAMAHADLEVQQAKEWEAQAELRDAEFHTRLLPRAKGNRDDDENEDDDPGWWFCGRHRALADINGWLACPDPRRPLRVVTGAPGSGKSAVLGLIAALARPEYRRSVPLHALQLPDDAIPRIGAVDVAIYAQNHLVEHVHNGIAAAAEIGTDTVGGLAAAIAARAQPFTVLIDGLDEAADPDALIRELLRPLLKHSVGKLRLLVGTRQHLLESLGTSSEAEIDLDSDRYADRDALTTYVVHGLRQTHRGSLYRSAEPATVRAVAEVVADQAYPSFLVARVVSATLAADKQLPDPNDGAWRHSLPRLPGEAMRRDLDQRLGEGASRARNLLRPLAFAQGQGLPWEDIWALVASRIAGTKYTDKDLRWLRRRAGSYVVEAVEAGRSAYRLYHQSFVEHLQEDIDTVAVHAAFVEVLISRIPLGTDGRRDWARAHPYTVTYLATHAAAAGTIDDLLTDTDYLVHAEPAALLDAMNSAATTAGQLTRAVYRWSARRRRNLLLECRGQVLAIDAARFRATSLQHDLSRNLTWSPLWATGYHINQDHPILNTYQVTAVACTVIDGTPAVVTVDGSNMARVWDLRTGNLRTMLADASTSMRAVACTEVDGVPVAVTGEGANDFGYGGNQAQVWDLRTGELRTTLDAAAVLALACTVIDGVPAVVTVRSEGGRAWVWDLRTGNEMVGLVGCLGPANTLACTVIDGTPVTVTCGRTGPDDGRAPVVFRRLHLGDFPYGIESGHAQRQEHDQRVNKVPQLRTGVWDLRTGELRTVIREGGAEALACTVIDGIPVAVIGDRHDGAWVVDLRTGELRDQPSHRRLRRHRSVPTPLREGWVQALACTVIDGIPVAVIGNRHDGAWVVDLRTGELRTVLDAESVSMVACATVDGTPVAVTIGYGRKPQVWDLRTGHDRTPPAALRVLSVWEFAEGDDRTVDDRHVVVGHAAPVLAVACTVIDGTPVAVTGSRDWTAGVWDLRTGVLRSVFTDPGGPVIAVACSEIGGIPVAVTASTKSRSKATRLGTTEVDRPARVWDLRTGDLRTVLGAATVLAVACTVIDGAPVAVTGGREKTPRVWDLRTGDFITDLVGHTKWVDAVACTVIDGIPVAVTGSRDTTARVWDLRTGDLRATFTGHVGWVDAVACAVIDGVPVAVTGSRDATARVWDLRSGDLIECIDCPESVSGLDIAVDTRIVLAMSSDIIVMTTSPN